MTKPLTAETFIAWMWAYEYRFDSKADHSAFRNRFSRQIARLNEDAYRSGQPRPLTPDDITDEMIERGARQYIEEDYTSWERSPALAKNNARESVRGILEAALTEPPARPEGAEELEADISRDGEAVTIDLTPDHVTALADHLAALGWTKETNR